MIAVYAMEPGRLTLRRFRRTNPPPSEPMKTEPEQSEPRRYTWSGGFIYDSANERTLARLQGPDQAENGKLICDALNACAGMQDPEREIAELKEKLRVAELKASASLANNLCPDHRDKQGGKQCLACEIEKLSAALIKANRQIARFQDFQSKL